MFGRVLRMMMKVLLVLLLVLITASLLQGAFLLLIGIAAVYGLSMLLFAGWNAVVHVN